MADISLPTRRKGIVEGIWDFFTLVAESNSRVKAVDRLNAMSDAQLAARGLKRDDIVHHVFKDVYYL